ncbi:MAG: hypothetical protein JRI25_26200 [Deltaproteobacteria bacterium]|nr:hypothetical protein [Deltaproteobacteria bacterium]
MDELRAAVESLTYIDLDTSPGEGAGVVEEDSNVVRLDAVRRASGG